MLKYFHLLFKTSITLILIFITVLYLISTMQPSTKKRISASPISCYYKQDASLPDFSILNPAKGKFIFFHETSCNSDRYDDVVISSRQACAVESAARTNQTLKCIYYLHHQDKSRTKTKPHIVFGRCYCHTIM